MRPELSAAGMICDFVRVYDTPRKAESRVKSHFTALAQRDVLRLRLTCTFCVEFSPSIFKGMHLIVILVL